MLLFTHIYACKDIFRLLCIESTFAAKTLKPFPFFASAHKRTQAHARTHTYTHSQSLSHTLAHFLSLHDHVLTNTSSFSPSSLRILDTRTHTLILSHASNHTPHYHLALPLSSSSRTFILSRSLNHTHAHTHTRTHSHSHTASFSIPHTHTPSIHI